MNDRIRELAKLTDELFAEGDSDFRPQWNKNFAWNKKFAELLVGECLEIVANVDMSRLEGPEPEDVLFVACTQIKEHFGVE